MCWRRSDGSRPGRVRDSQCRVESRRRKARAEQKNQGSLLQSVWARVSTEYVKAEEGEGGWMVEEEKTGKTRRARRRREMGQVRQERQRKERPPQTRHKKTGETEAHGGWARRPWAV